MEIDLIDDSNEFDRLKTNWEFVYSSDPHTHIFVSWIWLRGWFEITPYKWFVLAARFNNQKDYVAFIPLIMNSAKIRNFHLIRVLHGGTWPFAKYSGLLCLPEYQEEALGAFADYIQQELGWDTFQMEYALDPRLDFLSNSFPQHDFIINQVQCLPSLYIPSLSPSWEQYLNSLGKATRRTLKRRIKRIEENNKLQMIRADHDNFNNYLNAAVSLNQSKWGRRPFLCWEYPIFNHLFRNNCLWLTVLWDNSAPVSGQLTLIDELKKVAYAYLTGYSAEYSQFSPGQVIIGCDIKRAIETGLQEYDLSMGMEDYKFSFGATARPLIYTIMTRTTIRSKIANFELELARQLRDCFKKREH